MACTTSTTVLSMAPEDMWVLPGAQLYQTSGMCHHHQFGPGTDVLDLYGDVGSERRGLSDFGSICSGMRILHDCK